MSIAKLFTTKMKGSVKMKAIITVFMLRRRPISHQMLACLRLIEIVGKL